MKTRSSQRILLIVGLSALLSGPAFAAFGDNPLPSANALSGADAAGSALPPGTYPSSPADSDKKATDHKTTTNKAATPPKNDKSSSGGASSKPPSQNKQKKHPPRKDN